MPDSASGHFRFAKLLSENNGGNIAQGFRGISRRVGRNQFVSAKNASGRSSSKLHRRRRRRSKSN